jgi:Carboxypeptidase regulatory-like domain
MSAMRRPVGAFAAVATLALAVCAAFGQYVDLRSVKGTVTFPDGEPVRGAAVQLENTRTLQIRSYITKQDGQYHFQGLNMDVEYHLRAEYHGRFGPSKTVSQFSSKKETTVDLIANPGK